MDHKITPEAKELWLPLLEGGTLPQARNALYKDGGYCCLGAFAKAKGATFFVPHDEAETDEYGDAVGGAEQDCEVMLAGRNVNENELLDEAFAAQFGLTREVQGFLSNMNDGANEVAINHTDPLYHLWEKYAAVVPPSPNLYTHAGTTKFRVRPHTFAEIAQIIREEF